MTTQDAWESAIRSAVRWCEWLLKLEFLSSYKLRKFLANGLGVVSVLVVALLLFGVNDIAIAIFIPIAALWAVFFAVFIFLYLPSLAVRDLYFYLKGKDLPFSHAALITVFTIVGAVVSFIVLASWWR